MTKQDAGRLGGQVTVRRYGNSHMKRLAKMGAVAFHKKYHLVACGLNDFAIVNRLTGIPTGKTICGNDWR
jgi:hypothetical protein